MKKISTLPTIISILLVFLSCTNEQKNKPRKESSGQLSSIAPTEKRAAYLLSPENKKDETVPLANKDYLDSSWAGKTTSEIAPYHLHTCFGGMVAGHSENGKYAVAAYTSTVNQCQKGKNKIVLEKLLKHDAQGKAHFEIKDELIVTSNYPKRCYSTVVLQLQGDTAERSYLIAYEDNNKSVLKNVYQIWEINTITGKFIKMDVPKNLKCNNPGYADGL
ncbi:hypothetical protein ACLOAU_22130 [Niabella sp. CJ426]|uniref:hypothetical protein n=1 Tax=Niabella sp. CJ426 TaxID=3393740 RepID=UPI003D000CC1